MLQLQRADGTEKAPTLDKTLIIMCIVGRQYVQHMKNTQRNWLPQTADEDAERSRALQHKWFPDGVEDNIFNGLIFKLFTLEILKL